MRSVDSANYDRFRQLLIASRLRAGLSQVQLAKRLDRPQSFVSKYERGERRLDVIEFVEVTEIIGVDPGWIIAQLRADPDAGPGCGD